MTELHDWMSVIVEQNDCPFWLGEVEGDTRTLLRPPGNDVQRVWAGQSRNDGWSGWRQSGQLGRRESYLFIVGFRSPRYQPSNALVALALNQL